MFLSIHSTSTQDRPEEFKNAVFLLCPSPSPVRWPRTINRRKPRPGFLELAVGGGFLRAKFADGAIPGKIPCVYHVTGTSMLIVLRNPLSFASARPTLFSRFSCLPCSLSQARRKLHAVRQHTTPSMLGGNSNSVWYQGLHETRIPTHVHLPGTLRPLGTRSMYPCLRSTSG